MEPRRDFTYPWLFRFDTLWEECEEKFIEGTSNWFWPVIPESER